jgi:hypothetical protein
LRTYGLPNSATSSGRRGILRPQADPVGRQPDNACNGLILSFAFFVEVAAVDVVYDRDGEVLHLQAIDSFFNENLIIPPYVTVSLITF